MKYFAFQIDTTSRLSNSTFDIPNVSQLSLVYLWCSVFAAAGAGVFNPCGGLLQLANASNMCEVAQNFALQAPGQTLVFNGNKIFATHLLPWVGLLPVGGAFSFDIDYTAYPEVAGSTSYTWSIQLGFE